MIEWGHWQCGLLTLFLNPTLILIWLPRRFRVPHLLGLLAQWVSSVKQLFSSRLFTSFHFLLWSFKKETHCPFWSSTHKRTRLWFKIFLLKGKRSSEAMEFLHALFVFAFQKLSCEFLHVHMTPSSLVWFPMFTCYRKHDRWILSGFSLLSRWTVECCQYTLWLVCSQRLVNSFTCFMRVCALPFLETGIKLVWNQYYLRSLPD